MPGRACGLRAPNCFTGAESFRCRPFSINCPGGITTGRIMAMVIPGSSQSNRNRAELVALRRLGTVEDCAKVVEFLSRPGGGDLDRRRGLVRG